MFSTNNSHTEMPSSFMQRTQRKNEYIKQTKTEREPQDSPLKNTPTDQEKILANSKALILSHNLKKKPGNLDLVADFVKKNRDAIIRPPDNEVMKDIYIHICGLDGTMYSDEQYMLERWKHIYLPVSTKMEVIGILESSECMTPFPECIVLVGEDGHVYGYEDEVLYQFADSLKKLLQDGIKTDIHYDYPDDISDEEEEVLQKDEEIQELRQATKKFIDDDAEEFNDFMMVCFGV